MSSHGGERIMEFLKSFINRLRTDYSYKTFTMAGAALVITFFFAVYNAYLGVEHQSLWNGSIAAYYIVLTVLRGMIIAVENRIYRQTPAEEDQLRRRTFYISSAVLILMNIVLIIPISLMAELKKPVNMGLSPALIMAAYTFYKLILAGINFYKKNKSSHVLVKELRSISMIDALVSMIALQNALISVFGSVDDKEMIMLSGITDGLFFSGMIIISIVNLYTGSRMLANTEKPDTEAE